MQELIAQFEKYLLYEKRYSIHTASSYLIDLSQFSGFLSLYNIENIADVTEKHIRLWVRHLVSSNLKPRSVNRKITTAKSFFKFLLRLEVISISPAIRIHSLKTEKSLPTYIEESAMSNLEGIDFGEGIIGVRDRLIIDLFYSTGIRLSELTGLKLADFHENKRQLKVLGKGSKERIVPLLDHTRDLILEYLSLRSQIAPAHNKLFVTIKGDEIYTKLVYRVVNKYLNLATTAKKKSPHVLRHSFATHMLNKGADLNIIKEILGHTSLAATEVYTHNSFEKLKTTYKKSHPRE